MVIDGDSMSVEERLSPGAQQPATDLSGLQGFQFVGAREEPASASDEHRREALTLELDARAARFHQAVDSSIVLASDGTIRWLGDSIAKLTAGDDLLAPRTILLVDEAMSAEAQKIVLSRLELWLKATIQRLLGPLFSLRGMQEGSPQLQNLAAKIANALGVLERDPVRGIVRGLDQDARAVLRRLGVRFGSYYLYVPSTLRPASRALALQLWCVQKGDQDLSIAAQSLIPIASSGRTSAPPGQRVNPETYRVGGFRSCGERVVRVDIVERLADMIRAASTLRLLNGSNSGPTAFQVTNQMTSLTGCSGDSFSSVLRALGFESLTVARSEIVWPAASAPASPPEAAEPQSQEPDTHDDAFSAKPPSAQASNLPTPRDGGPPSHGEAAAEHGPPPDDDAPEGAAPELAAPPEDRPPPHGEAPQEVGAPPEDGPPQGASPPELEASPEDGAAPPADSPASEAAESHRGLEAPIPQPPEVQTEDPEKEACGASVKDEVVVWRFARVAKPSRPRPSRPPRRRFAVHAPQRVSRPAAAEVPLNGVAPDPEPQAPAGVKGSGDKLIHKDRRAADAGKRQCPPDPKREGRVTPGGRPNGERKPAVDPNSPFAKLMELRSILESESKKRS
jgi:ATP-dependent RNA helicase SUPV3L1/SUV3